MWLGGGGWIVKKLILGLAFLFILVCPSLADLLSDNKEVLDSASPLNDNEKVLDSNLHTTSDLPSDNKEVLGSNVSMGIDVNYYLYKETKSNSSLMKLSGIKRGFWIDADRRLSDSSFGAVQLRLMTGSLDYDGHTMDLKNTRKFSGSQSSYFECRGL
jgi:hypothetical protein